MRDQKLLLGLIGSIIGLAGAFALNVITRCREDEKSRSEQRAIMAILTDELRHPASILCNKYANVVLSGDPLMGDEVKSINRDKCGITFDYANEIANYHTVFDVLKDKLGFIKVEFAVKIWIHCTNLKKILIAHKNATGICNRDSDKVAQILNSIRTELSSLIHDGTIIASRKGSGLFFIWLPIWLVGRA